MLRFTGSIIDFLASARANLSRLSSLLLLAILNPRGVLLNAQFGIQLHVETLVIKRMLLVAVVILHVYIFFWRHRLVQVVVTVYVVVLIKLSRLRF